MVHEQESSIATKYQIVLLGQENKKKTSPQTSKDAKIALLKVQHKHGELDVLDNLIKISSFVQEYK